MRKVLAATPRTTSSPLHFLRQCMVSNRPVQERARCACNFWSDEGPADYDCSLRENFTVEAVPPWMYILPRHGTAVNRLRADTRSGYRAAQNRHRSGKHRPMFTSNPFAALSASVPPVVMQA